MQKKRTATLDEQVYRGQQTVVGRRRNAEEGELYRLLTLPLRSSPPSAVQILVETTHLFTCQSQVVQV